MTEKRENLQDLAQEHVRHYGLKGLSFRTLAEEAGIKSSSVHYYFPEKSDLATALIERYPEAIMGDPEFIPAIASWNSALCHIALKNKQLSPPPQSECHPKIFWS